MNDHDSGPTDNNDDHTDSTAIDDKYTISIRAHLQTLDRLEDTPDVRCQRPHDLDTIAKRHQGETMLRIWSNQNRGRESRSSAHRRHILTR